MKRLLCLCLVLLPTCGPSADDGTVGADAAVTGDPARAADDVAPPAAPDDALPPTAQPEILRAMREDRDAPRHPGDGQGRVWLDDGPASIPAATAGRWTVAYEAAPTGVAEGGSIYLTVPPFWNWSEPWVATADTPVAERDGRPGLTEVSCDAAGVRLELARLDTHLVAARVGGRALSAGEVVRFVYGAGEAMARSDRYAEHDEAFLVAVDADGDGVRELVPGGARVDVTAREAAQLAVHLPSCLEPGARGRLVVAVLDGAGNAFRPWVGSLSVEAPEWLGLPDVLELGPDDEGLFAREFEAAGEGVVRVLVESADGLAGMSNPLVVQAGLEPIWWGDLQVHSGVSDGSGTPDDIHRYARDVAALDLVALTDHDHWGQRFLDKHDALWQANLDTVRRYDEPGRFLALPGYEWTNWVEGHRHVVGFGADDGLPLLSSIDEASDTPDELWARLRDLPVLTFAHHSAGGPVATDWAGHPPDAVLEPLTEVVSVHGSSEAWDSPQRIHRPLRGNFVRDVLLTGARLGFVGGGDSHDGHPGLAHLASPTGGVMAVLGGELTRAGVLQTLRARRTYATTGARMIVRASLGGARQGGSVRAADGPASLVVLVHGTHLLDGLEVIRGEQVVHVEDWRDEPRLDAAAQLELRDLRAGEFVYLRVHQADGHVAWTSPFFVD